MDISNNLLNKSQIDLSGSRNHQESNNEKQKNI